MSEYVQSLQGAGRKESPGLWLLAWRRFCHDRVGVVSLAIVGFFCVLVLAAGLHLVADDWADEAGVNYAPPSFMGPDRAEVQGLATGPASDTPATGDTYTSDITDPLADVLAEIRRDPAEAQAPVAKAPTLAFGGDKWGRDVLKKVIKGTQTSMFVGIAAAILATLIGAVFGALAGYYGRTVDDFFNWFYSIFTAVPYLLLILAIAAVLNQKGTLTVVLILGLTGWPGIFRLVRAEYLKHRTREYIQAADAIGASNRKPRDSRSAFVARRALYQVRSDIEFPGLRRRGGYRLVGQHAQRSAERTHPGQMVATRCRHIRDGAPCYGVQPLYRCAARRARSTAQMKSPAQTEVLLAVRDLKVDFRIDRTDVLRAVKGISFDVPVNSTVALVGESGSGKSVTALAIMGLLPKENARAGGRVLYRGRNLLDVATAELRALRGADISMIFQEPMSSLNPVFTVGFQLREVLTRHLHLARRQAHTRALELLHEVGIPDPAIKIDAYPFELSGGQQQRVMIAMAIACEPKLLIADEPTTALDVTIQQQILDLLAALKSRHAMSVLFITHDLAVVGSIANRVIVMRDGVIREQGEVQQIFEAPTDAYTKALLLCRPRMTKRPRRLPVIDDFLGASSPASAGEPQRTRGLTGDEAIVLEVRQLRKSFYSRAGLFGKKEFRAVNDVSFKLAKGKTLGLVGESGSGKSTLGLALVRLHEATTGQVLFDGRDLLALSPSEMMDFKRRIQIVFQNPYASLNPRFTVGQILQEPMEIHDIGGGSGERRDAVYALLERVALPVDSFFKYPHEFSGGQRQRIAIARSLTMRPEVLICDEPVSALDVSVQAQVLNLLQDLQDEFGLSYLFISHDLAVVKYMADQVMVMSRGEIVEIANSDDIYARPQHPYTKQLLASMPRALSAPQSGAA
jgi:peptide/nickel transport system ATP-binding protein